MTDDFHFGGHPLIMSHFKRGGGEVYKMWRSVRGGKTRCDVSFKSENNKIDIFCKKINEIHKKMWIFIQVVLGYIFPFSLNFKSLK